MQNLPFELTQFIWSFIENETIKQFFDNSKNTRKALETTQLIWKRLGAYWPFRCHQNGCDWDEDTPTWAAQIGHLEIVKYCYENNCPWNESNIREQAARNNHQHILEYLDSIQ